MKSVGKDLIFIKIQLPSSFTILLINSTVLYICFIYFSCFFYSSLNNLLFLIKKIAFYKKYDIEVPKCYPKLITINFTHYIKIIYLNKIGIKAKLIF